MAPKVFISHAAVDHELAAALAAILAEAQPPLDTFLSSRPGDIRADAEWLPAIQAALLDATAFLILLTPNSIGRPWVAFETGAAWFCGRPIVLVRVSALAEEEIPLPTSARQIYRVDQPDELSVVCHALGTRLKDAAAAAGALRRLPVPSFAGAGEPAWEGIVHDGQYYAWAGPLLGLEDKAAVACAAGLEDALRTRGLTPRGGRKAKLEHHLGRGRAQVFATDRRSWRRPVEIRGQLLLVGGLRSDAHRDPAA